MTNVAHKEYASFVLQFCFGVAEMSYNGNKSDKKSPTRAEHADGFGRHG
jgi:hypothetical protein